MMGRAVHPNGIPSPKDPPPLAASEDSTLQHHRILMVSDFFYPNVGGVENHIYQLAQCLIKLGHEVVIVTHAYGDCCGIRRLTNGLKVYYLYRRPFVLQTTFPTLFGGMRMLRQILLREGITIVHAHQAFSVLGLEACLTARIMGFKVVFTDHSLFGFADAASILMNKMLKCCLADIHMAICVSHTSKENTVLRACLPPCNVYVIPNAVNADDFTPAVSEGEGCSTVRGRKVVPAKLPIRDPHVDPVVIVALSRLVYRKGVDLMALVIPHICRAHPNISFIIGGDGPKRQLLEEMVEDSGLGDRVTLIGAVPQEEARDFLIQGHIFLNASLTEAFCMAIVEAAAVGLTVVSTKVGGVPEVLPPDLMVLAEPSAEGLCRAIEEALARLPMARPLEQHRRVRDMYSWDDVAERTVKVYSAAAASRRDDSMGARLARYCACGPWVGRAFAAVAVIGHLYWQYLEWVTSAAEVERAVDWPRFG